MIVGLAHAFVDHLLDRQLRIPAHIHTDLQEHGDDAGVLADRPVTLGAHARIDQDLGDGVLGCGRFLALVGLRQILDVVHRMEIADVLQRIGYGLHEIGLTDGGHGPGTGMD